MRKLTMEQILAREPSQANAHFAVRWAIRHGYLIRPHKCEYCGAVPSVGRDGRTLIQGHHHKGYEHPLDVLWLCLDCHAHDDTNTRARGPHNGWYKHSDEVVRDVHARAARGESRKSIARLYKMSDATVWRYLNKTHRTDALCLGQ